MVMSKVYGCITMCHWNYLGPLRQGLIFETQSLILYLPGVHPYGTTLFLNLFYQKILLIWKMNLLLPNSTLEQCGEAAVDVLGKVLGESSSHLPSSVRLPSPFQASVKDVSFYRSLRETLSSFLSSLVYLQSNRKIYFSNLA